MKPDQGRGKSGARLQSAPSILGNFYQLVEYENKFDDELYKLKDFLPSRTVNFEPADQYHHLS